MPGRLILFEDAGFASLLPLVYWRTVFELRCGRMTLGERLARSFGPVGGLWTRAWIAEVASERIASETNPPAAAGDTLVNARWLPHGAAALEPGPFVGVCDGQIAYVVCDDAAAQRLDPGDFLDRERWADVIDALPHGPAGGRMLSYPWDLVTANTDLLQRDGVGGAAAIEGDVHASAVVVNHEAVRIEAGARVDPLAVLDARDGPIVIERGARIGAHCCIAGPAHIGPACVVNPHSHLHGGVTLGPTCKVGGEIDASIFLGFSNKQHHGFLGHAVIGSWVNLGAGTSNSDLKNTYGPVRVPINGRPVDTDLQFFGAVIGDHVKTAIHCTLPTGAVIGLAANLATNHLPPPFVRSFTWMTDLGVEEGDADRLIKTAAMTMQRRGLALTVPEQTLFHRLPEIVAYFEPPLRPTKPRDEQPEPEPAYRTAP